MKKQVLLVLLFIPFICLGQDIITLKDGTEIKAKIKIIGKNEIKYKKSGTSGPLYSIPLDIVLKVTDEDGKEINIGKETQSADSAGLPKLNEEGIYVFTTKYYLGGFSSICNSYRRGNIDTWWSYKNSVPDMKVNAGNEQIFGFQAGLLMKASEKFQGGDQIDFIFTRKNAIWDSNSTSSGLNEVELNSLILNIGIPLHFSLTQIKALNFTFQPSITMGFMGGQFKLAGDPAVYKESATIGLGGTFEGGIDFELAKRLMLFTHFGYRLLGIGETHKDSSSSTGYKYFYTDASGTESVKVKWSGMFVTYGLKFFIGKHTGINPL